MCPSAGEGRHESMARRSRRKLLRAGKIERDAIEDMWQLRHEMRFSVNQGAALNATKWLRIPARLVISNRNQEVAHEQCD
jgi:hypothetical protein